MSDDRTRARVWGALRGCPLAWGPPPKKSGILILGTFRRFLHVGNATIVQTAMPPGLGARNRGTIIVPAVLVKQQGPRCPGRRQAMHLVLSIKRRKQPELVCTQRPGYRYCSERKVWQGTYCMPGLQMEPDKVE